MQHTMFVRFVFRPSEAEGEGNEGSVQCRITVDKVRRKFTTPVRCLLKEWDPKGQCLKGQSKKARLAKTVLGDIKSDIDRLYYDMERRKEYITAERLLKAYLQQLRPRTTLLFAWQEFIEQRTPLIGISLSKAKIQADTVRLGHLQEFLTGAKSEDILPEEFTAKRADSFQAWLRVKRGVSQNYTSKVLQTVKQVLRWCVVQEYAKQSPLASYALKFEATEEIVYLTPMEIAKMLLHPFASEPLQRAADIFLFQCFTGLAFADVKRFDAQNDLAPGPDGKPWIYMQRQKTQHSSGRQATVPLSPSARKLLARYGNQLPVPSNQIFNRYLKEIGAILNFTKVLTTHVGRKTAGMILLQDGVSLTVVSKVLGHASVTMTEKYYTRILDTMVADEFKRVYGRTGTDDAGEGPADWGLYG